jgi:hypothetical protein
MLNYLLRRVLYAIPILLGVNVLTFAVFFVVNTPDDMARMQLGVKRVTPEAIERWKHDRGYDRPLLLNDAATGMAKVTDTIFYRHSLKLFLLDFGKAESDGRDIGQPGNLGRFEHRVIGIDPPIRKLAPQPNPPLGSECQHQPIAHADLLHRGHIGEPDWCTVRSIAPRARAILDVTEGISAMSEEVLSNLR